jgi:wyosine [tRNA(Phe)-imidazoG37] synthetase (radical SAM superfamily)
MEQLIFGPVPSRRLGRSIGVNNIPYKVCSYACSYCQVGKAVQMQVHRREFYQPDAITEQVETRLKGLASTEYPDYITIVPDGEPTLDLRLGELIRKLKTFGIPVAVITNSSLLPAPGVHDDLMQADYVSVKADSVCEPSWRKINKPHKSLQLERILQAMEVFARSFRGTLVTESMLIKGVNDHEVEITALAQFLRKINPSVAYIAIPTRPPALENTLPADEDAVAMAYQIFLNSGLFTELLTGYEGNAFSSSGNFIDDILSITAVHPMRKDAVMQLMSGSNGTMDDLNRMILQNDLIKIAFNNEEYYLRRFHKDKKR